jgi:hypothetical protein
VSREFKSTRTRTSVHCIDLPSAALDLLDVENAELDRLYHDLYHDGTISDVTRRRIQRSLDLEHAGLGEGLP